LLCFASVFFVSLQNEEKKRPFSLFSLIFALFILLCFFRFVSLFSLRFASFPFRFACKIYCFASKRNKRNKPLSFASKRQEFRSVSLSFTSNRKRTAHPTWITFLFIYFFFSFICFIPFKIQFMITYYVDYILAMHILLQM
jgi:uncharacterized membrane protein (DUF485 family)